LRAVSPIMCGGLQVGHFVERACLDEDDPLRPGFWHVGEHRRTTVRAEAAIDRLTAVAPIDEGSKGSVQFQPRSGNDCDYRERRPGLLLAIAAMAGRLRQWRPDDAVANLAAQAAALAEFSHQTSCFSPHPKMRICGALQGLSNAPPIRQRSPKSRLAATPIAARSDCACCADEGTSAVSMG